MRQYRDEETATTSKSAADHEQVARTKVALEETEDDDQSQQDNSKLIQMENVHVAKDYDNIDRQLSIDSE